MKTTSNPSSRGIRIEKDKLILGVLLCGFLLTVIEVRFLHQRATSETVYAWIPTVAAGLGAFACAMGLWGSKWTRMLAAIALSCVMVAGIIGMGLHTELKPTAFSTLFMSQQSTTGSQRDWESAERHEANEEGEGESSEQRPIAKFSPASRSSEGSKAPALAPLTISGLALIGAFTLVGGPNRKAKSD